VIKMKSLPRLLVAGIALAILVMPLAILADQLPLPLEKKVPAGVTSVTYMNQTLRFTTAVPLVIKFEALSDNQIRLTVRTYNASSGGAQGSSSSSMNIHWEDWNNDVYEGPPPTEPWEGILYTESGFTEK